MCALVTKPERRTSFSSILEEKQARTIEVSGGGLNGAVFEDAPIRRTNFAAILTKAFPFPSSVSSEQALLFVM